MERQSSTASSASSLEAKKTTPAKISAGMGSSATSASSVTPSVPSEPQKRSIQSIPGWRRYPAVYLVVLGMGSAGTAKSIGSPRRYSRTAPSSSATRSARRWRRVLAETKAARAAGIRGDGAAERGGDLGGIGRIELAGEGGCIAEFEQREPGPTRAKPCLISSLRNVSSESTQPPCGTREPVRPEPAPAMVMGGVGLDGFSKDREDLRFIFGKDDAIGVAGEAGGIGEVRRADHRLRAAVAEFANNRLSEVYRGGGSPVLCDGGFLGEGDPDSGGLFFEFIHAPVGDQKQLLRGPGVVGSDGHAQAARDRNGDPRDEDRACEWRTESLDEALDRGGFGEVGGHVAGEDNELVAAQGGRACRRSGRCGSDWP